MQVRYSYSLSLEKIFTEKCSWDTKWTNKKDNCKLLEEVSSKHDHKAIAQMKRDTYIRVSTPQYLSLVHRHLVGKLSLLEHGLANETQFPQMIKFFFIAWD